jgi:hypothetical protein
MGPKFEVASVEIKCLQRERTHKYIRTKDEQQKQNTVRGFGAEIHSSNTINLQIL